MSMRGFYSLPAESKAAIVLTFRKSVSHAIGQVWTHLGVPLDGDTVTRKSYDTDMQIAVWLISRLLDQKAGAQSRLQESARTIRYLQGRLNRSLAAWATAREFQIAHAAALADIDKQFRRLNISDHRPLLDRVTDLVDCELLRRANNG